MPTPHPHPWFRPGGHSVPGKHKASDEAILRAFRETAQLNGFGSDPAPREKALLKWSLAAAKSLAHYEQDAEILHIADALPPHLHNGTRFALMRCKALARQEDWDGLVDELRAIASQATPEEPVHPRLADFAQSSGVPWAIRGDGPRDSLLDGPTPSTPEEYYFGGLEEQVDQAISSRLKKREADEVNWVDRAEEFLAMIGKERSPENLKASLRGQFLRRRDATLWKIDGASRKLDLAKYGLEQAGAKIQDLMSSAERLIVADTTPLEQNLAEGRNIIVLRVHCSVRLIERRLCHLGVPVAMLANGEYPKPGVRTYTVGSPAKAGIALLKAAKALRSDRHIAVVMPDGAQGKAFAETTLQGRKVTVGTGGASLAHVHPSALFFAYSSLVDRNFHLKLIPGALIDRDMPKEEVEAAFVALYVKGLQTVLEGQLEDIGLSSIMKSFRGADE